jgi:hypothetical protein
MASVHHISVVEVVSEPAALRCIKIPRMDRKKTMTYYISPARYAISFSDRRYRSRSSINEALKLGRTPPFIYAVLSFPRHIHPDTRTYKVNPDTIEQPKIHLGPHGRLFPGRSLPLCKPSGVLEVNMRLKYPWRQRIPLGNMQHPGKELNKGSPETRCLCRPLHTSIDLFDGIIMF